MMYREDEGELEGGDLLEGPVSEETEDEDGEVPEIEEEEKAWE